MVCFPNADRLKEDLSPQRIGLTRVEVMAALGFVPNVSLKW